MKTPTKEQLDNWFDYHPGTPEQEKQYEELRADCKAYLARLLECWMILPAFEGRSAAVRARDEFAARLMTLPGSHIGPASRAISQAGSTYDLLFEPGIVCRHDAETRLTVAINYARETMFWGCAAIACGGV